MKKKKEAKKGGRVKKVLMAIAIAIILAFFVGYGVNTFYKEPKWEDYCTPKVYEMKMDTRENCESIGGNWTQIPSDKAAPAQELKTNQYLCTKQPSIQGEDILLSCVTKEEIQQNGYCDPDYKCRTAFEQALEPHNRISFILLAIIGLVIITIATIVIKENVIGYGTLAGGILTVLYGTIRFWGSIPDMARFAILGIVLFVLITIAWKKLVK
jgi:hypothetical protein